MCSKKMLCVLTIGVSLLLTGCPDDQSDDDSSLVPSPSPKVSPTPGTVTPTSVSETPTSAPPTPTMSPEPEPTPSPTPPTDLDGDGVVAALDCDDQNDTAYPGADEVCDGVDNDCDEEVDPASAVDAATWYQDLDGDGSGNLEVHTVACAAPWGYVGGSGDCDDADPTSYPGAEEACDGADNDCDEEVDEDFSQPMYLDADGDGFGDPDAEVAACPPSDDKVTDSSDCDDTRDDVYPGALEVCDGLDNDCDNEAPQGQDPPEGGIDEGVQTTYHPDADGDGFGDGTVSLLACEAPEGYLEDDGGAAPLDCDDTLASVYPGATETCNEVDDDCDEGLPGGGIDEGVTTESFLDADGDGYGDAEHAIDACGVPSGYVSNDADCDDRDGANYPGGREVCDGGDNNCDGKADEGLIRNYFADSDGDGYGDPMVSIQACSAQQGYVADKTDCDDTNGEVYPGADEVCNLIDDDCDQNLAGGGIDEGVELTFYVDSDGDGFGSDAETAAACTAPAGFCDNTDDCDDAKTDVFPGATETCNLIDDDCDGLVDEDVKTVFYQDLDDDGHGDPDTTEEACSVPDGFVAIADDCLDSDNQVFPGATEVANGIDDDCDEEVDEGVFFEDCRALGNALPSSPSGIYTIDPDGEEGEPPFEVYCDLDSDGGGWTLVGRLMQADYDEATDFMYDACGQTLEGCNFGDPAEDPDLSLVNVNLGFFMSTFPGEEHKMEFLNDGAPPTQMDYFAQGWVHTRSCDGTIDACLFSASCYDGVAYSIVQYDQCQHGPNLFFSPGRRWGTNENDEICDYTCANGGNYPYKSDEIRFWTR